MFDFVHDLDLPVVCAAAVLIIGYATWRRKR